VFLLLFLVVLSGTIKVVVLHLASFLVTSGLTRHTELLGSNEPHSFQRFGVLRVQRPHKMPTTRSRSRAPKEPSVEELGVEKYLEELNERLKKAFTTVEDELDEIYKQIDSLSDWAEHHSDFHKRVSSSLNELYKPPTVWEDVCEFYSFVFHQLCTFLLVLCPLLLLVLLVFSIDFFVGYGIF